MTSTLDHRLTRLEATKAPPLRQRYVWLSSPEDLVPKAESGEQLVVYSWAWVDDDDMPVPAATLTSRR